MHNNLPLRETIKKYLVGSITIFLTTIAFVHISHYLDSFVVEKYVSDSTWVEVSGKFSKYSHAPKGTECAFNYEYDNIKYYNVVCGGYDIDKYFAKIGDNFILKINPKSPEDYFPIVWKPFFLPDEKTFFVDGEVIHIKKRSDNEFILFRNFFHQPLDSPICNYEVHFIYSVDNILFEKGQYLSPYLDSVNKKIKVGQKFKVECLIENPQRAIIHTESSTSDVIQ